MRGEQMKNAHIIHMLKGRRYLCIGACGTTKEKSTKDWKKVTCKNCLRYKK